MHIRFVRDRVQFLARELIKEEVSRETNYFSLNSLLLIFQIVRIVLNYMIYINTFEFNTFLFLELEETIYLKQRTPRDFPIFITHKSQILLRTES